MGSGISSQQEAGFTLLETLVALFILSVVSAAGTAMLISAIETNRAVETRSARQQDLDLAQAFLRNDISALSARGVRPDDGFSPAGNLFGRALSNGQPFLSFVRSGWLNPGGLARRSTLQAVDYRLEEGQLIRRAYVRPDTSSRTPASELVLLDGVGSVELRFFRGDSWSDIWIGDAGQPLEILPDLIEVRVIFESDMALTLVALTGGRR